MWAFVHVYIIVECVCFVKLYKSLCIFQHEPDALLFGADSLRVYSISNPCSRPLT